MLKDLGSPQVPYSLLYLPTDGRIEITDADRETYAIPAERLCAAALSYAMGLRSVDYTLKTHVRPSDDTDPAPVVSDYWITVAKAVMESLYR